MLTYASGGGAGGAGAGDVVGPASSTDNAIARFDGTTGKLLQNSALTVADTTGNVQGPAGGFSITGGTAASDPITIASTSHATKGPVQITGSLKATTDNAYDIGASSANRFKDVYLSGNIPQVAQIGDSGLKSWWRLGTDFRLATIPITWSPTNAGTGADVGLLRDSVGVLRVTNASTGVGNLVSSRLVLPEITSPETVAVTDSRKCITNDGAGGAVTYNLPAAAVGLEYYFAVVTAQNMVIDAAGTDTIRVATGVSSAGGTATNGAIGSTLHLLCVAAGQWFAIDAPNGTWTLA